MGCGKPLLSGQYVNTYLTKNSQDPIDIHPGCLDKVRAEQEEHEKQTRQDFFEEDLPNLTA